MLHRLRKAPTNIAGMSGVQPGMTFGAHTFLPNATDINGRPYVAGASVEFTTATGVHGGVPTGRFLYIWGGEWGKVSVRDPNGDEHEIPEGWYPWPEDGDGTQGVLL